MQRHFCVSLVVISVLLALTNPCRADHDHYSYSDWNDWAAALSLGILGMGLWVEMNRLYYPSPQVSMQPPPEETLRPGSIYYCVYSNGSFPYVQGCPGGWLMVVPVPESPSQE